MIGAFVLHCVHVTMFVWDSLSACVYSVLCGLVLVLLEVCVFLFICLCSIACLCSVAHPAAPAVLEIDRQTERKDTVSVQ